MKKTLLALLLVAVMLFGMMPMAAFAEGTEPQISNFDSLVDFVVEVEGGRDIKVLQLTDIQIIDAAQTRPGRENVDYVGWATENMPHKAFNCVTQVVKNYDPDLIIITGDLIYGEFDDAGTSLQAVIELMDSFQIPWAPVFGNHDNESAKGVDWQCQQLENSQYCLFEQKTLTGNGNYSVGLVQDGKLARVFYMLDSGGCLRDPGLGADQISWYTDSIQAIKQVSPETKYSMAFHIQPEVFNDAYSAMGVTPPTDLDAGNDSENFGYLGRALKTPWDTDHTVWNGIKALGIDSIFVGHEHSNSASVMYDGVRLAYGLKTGTYDRANYRMADGSISVANYSEVGIPIVGGTAIELGSDGSISDTYHVYYRQDNTQPAFSEVSMTLNSILNVNFKVAANGPNMSGYSVKAVIGNDADGQNIHTYTMDGALYVYTAKLLAHRMHEPIRVSIMKGSEVIEEKTFRISEYVEALKASSNSTELDALLDSMVDYGTYAAAYANGTVVTDETVDAVDKSLLEACKMAIHTVDGSLGLVASLYLDDSCDLRIKFNADAFEGCTLYIDDEAVDAAALAAEGSKLVYSISEILPQKWSKLYNIRIVKGEQTLADVDYSVLSYAYIALSKAQEAKTGLNGLLKAMYLYSADAKVYQDYSENPLTGAVANLLAPTSWSAGGTAGIGNLKLPANATLKADYLKSLWDEGYTHLVFAVNLGTDGAYVHGGNDIYRFWNLISAGTKTDVRIDINEFHDGDTWYDLRFTNMAAGSQITVSDPRAYKSAETLEWTKSATNSYFAIEDGYYVFDTRADGQKVVSPTEWLAKYCVGNDKNQQTWYVYTDFIAAGNNTRSVLWGWGNTVNHIKSGTDGGWVVMGNMQNDGYTVGEVFSLKMERGGISRFKISNIVSNYNKADSLIELDENTFQLSSTVNGRKYFLTTTQELKAAGYTKLDVTLTGTLPEGVTLWCGDGDFNDTEGEYGVASLVGGQHSFQVDLGTFDANQCFIIRTNGASDALPITDLQVKIVPSGYVKPLATYAVTAPTGEGFAFDGAATATEGQSYTFTVTPNNALATVTVAVNGNVIAGVDGTYTVENVNADLTITVEVAEPNIVKQILNSDNWNTVPQGSTATSVTLSANSSLKGEYLKALWNEGYTHLVFTVTAESATNYTHGGNWERYWRGLTAGSQDIRIDINEFHDGDTWYSLNFSAGEMTVSNPKAYKSAETLAWTKIGAGTPSNVYFAIEDGYYVLETITAQGVTSPTEWLAKYCVADDAGQRSWRVYTDYISQGNNTRSALWGWGTAMDVISGNANGGWSWLNGVQTDGYTEGEVFSLHTDVGGTARFKILDWVSNRNVWNAAQRLDYVDDQTVIWSGADSYKLRLATTQDLIAAGATALKVTLTGDLGSALIWYGEDDWGDGEVGIDASRFVNGSYTFTVDLTTFKENENFTLMGNAAAFTDMQVKIEPVMDGKPQVKKAIVVPDGSMMTVGNALANELNSVDSGYAVYTQKQVAAYDLKKSIILGSNFNGVTFQASSLGEAYAVVGDGNNIYIDGNCDRALVYGGFDLLRSLGYEFYSASLTARPASLNVDYSVNLQDSADFAVRAYLSGSTSYTTDSSHLAFTAASKNNNGQYIDLSSYGGTVDYGYYENPTHNFIHYFNDQTEGKYGKTVATGNVAVGNAFAPCLTNGITYNIGGADTTLTYAVARMKALILNDPDKHYFTFCQDDGTTWHCDCQYCTASNTQYNASGTLVNFINAMIAALKADSELAGRDFEIITLAYSFTVNAPVGVVPCEDLVIWYAGFQDSRYSITAANQTAGFKDNLSAWLAVTDGEQDGSLALWLYDTSFNNYMNYYSSTTINNAVDETIAAARAAGVDNILVLGAYTQQNNWQADMKAYIWSAKLWGTDKTTAQLQDAFIDAYFGPAASYAREFISIYDTAQKNLSSDWMISSGWGFYYRNNMRMTVHGEAINQALAAIAATEQGSVYWQRANGLLASAYAAVIYSYDQHLSDCTGIMSYSNGCREYAELLGDSKEAFTQMLKDAFANAGVTRPCEPDLTIDQWLEQYVNVASPKY